MVATAGIPSATATVAVCAFWLPTRSAAREAAAKRTAPVSFGPIDAASVTRTLESSAASPVETETPEALAAPVANSEKTKSLPARLASETGSEKVTATVVVLEVAADAIAGPALSRAESVTAGTCASVPESTRAALAEALATVGVAPVSKAASSTSGRVRFETPEAA